MSMHWAHRISWIIVVVVIVLPANVFAQVPENVRTVIAQLSSQEQQKVRQGYLALAALDTSAAEACLPTANRVLARGLPVPLAITAIRALGDVGHVTSSRSIRAYLMHRHVEVRREAVNALGKTGGPDARAGLRRALSDADASVRGFAASGLGQVGAKEHVGALFSALDQGVQEAAASIGMLCSPAECEGLVARADRMGLEVVSPGLREILLRHTTEVTENIQLSIIERISQGNPRKAQPLLKDVQSRRGRTGSRRVNQAIDLAVRATRPAPEENR
ncbi:MAG TPA: HEAT repeat domain-containing protein [Polyangiaceae bacterium]|nr:HEAT repeat domain-containing protein [Polyangiaceae bacterium]HQM08705.1 HEAT repeat domain-containing protein [Polyangiaceae bacterium]